MVNNPYSFFGHTDRQVRSMIYGSASRGTFLLEPVLMISGCYFGLMIFPTNFLWSHDLYIQVDKCTNNHNHV